MPRALPYQELERVSVYVELFTLQVSVGDSPGTLSNYDHEYN